MRLYFYGHDYKYAAEQMLLTMLPSQRPEYPEGKPEGERMEIKLSRGNSFLTASCLYVNGAGTWRGTARASLSRVTDALTEDRVCQRLIKNAMYRACLSSGVPKPVWGALTGVRPGKLLCGLINTCPDEESALKRFTEEYDVSPERAALCMDTARETLKAEKSMAEKDVCLYVGIPFCPTRCAYCSFVSQSVEKSMKLIPPFLEALLQETEAAAEQLKRTGLRVVSIYMGGGTPTTLNAEQLETLCSKIEECFDLSGLREYTVEAGRPDTITEDRLAVLRAHGVSRVSVNPQTMSDSVLETIGRRHTAADIESALRKVRAAGGFEVNMDLIAGLPSDTPEGFRETLEKVLSMGPENITVHTLSLKKGSAITVSGAEIPGAEAVGDMLDYASARLRECGYRPYYLYRQKFMSGGFENVGWAKGDTVNLYNICIMEELRSIIALGGGGSTKLIRPGSGRNIRFISPKYPKEYIEGIGGICSGKSAIFDFYNKEE